MSRKKYKIKLESELYQPTKELFQRLGYSVKGEVKGCDLTAIKEDQLVIAELKKNLSIDLLLQGILRKKLTDSVYLVIPKLNKSYRKWQEILRLVKMLELGLIVVTFFDESSAVAEVVVDPSDSQKVTKSKKKRDAVLKEINSRATDGNLGGSTKKKLLTGYREAAIHIACCLEKGEPLSTKQLKEMGTDKKKTTAILGRNFYGWFEKTALKSYQLTEIGRVELNSYQETADFYRKIVEKYGTHEQSD